MSLTRMFLAIASTAIVFACTASPELALAAATEQKALSMDVTQLAERSAEANAALLGGDVKRYRSLLKLSEDFTLMSPFGGQPSRSGKLSDERWAEIGRFFRNGSLRQEVVETYATDDMIVLAVIERARVEVGGLPAQDWALRVTLVFRRDRGEWTLVHRHADPLAPGISLEQAAALARGEGR